MKKTRLEKDIEQQESKINAIQNESYKDSIIDYAVDSVLNKITDGNLNTQTSNFQISYNKILSEKHKKMVYQITEFPTGIYVGHLEHLRERLRSALAYDLKDKIDLQIMCYDIPNKTSVTSNKITRAKRSVNLMRNRQAKLVKAFKGYSKSSGATLSKVNEGDRILAESRLKRIDRKLKSFSWVIRHSTRNGGYFNSYVFLELVCPDMETLSMTDEILQRLLQRGINNEPYKFEVLTADLYDYIKRFGLVSLTRPVEKKDTMPYMQVTSNVSVAGVDFKPGIVRATRPKVYLGHIIKNQYPFHVSFSDSTDASNILILADTGSGKTTEAEVIVSWLLLDPKQHVIVNDYKGGEWDALAKKVKGSKTLSFAFSDPKVINTLKIPDYKILGYKNPKQAYTLSAHITADILVSLVNPPKDKISIVQAICADIVSWIYINAGIDINRPDTYKLSEDLRFSKSIWEGVNGFLNGKVPMDVSSDKYSVGAEHSQYTNADLNLVKGNLADYFYYRGSRTTLFENEATLEDYLDTRLLIINHGHQTVGGNLKTDAEYRCTDLMKNYVANIYCGIHHLHDQYSAEVQEEVAQLVGDPVACKYLCRDITGCRSMNKMNILITNSIDPIINPVENREFLKPVKTNLNIFLLGRCELTEAKALVKFINKPQIYEDALRVAAQEEPELEHAFMYIQKQGEMRGSEIIKAILPKDIVKTVMKSKTVDTSGVLD